MSAEQQVIIYLSKCKNRYIFNKITSPGKYYFTQRWKLTIRIRTSPGIFELFLKWFPNGMPAADGTIKISINNRNEIISNLTKRNFHNNWNSLVSETTFFAYLFQVLVFEVRLSQLFQWREWKYESPGWEFWWRLLKVLSDIYFSQCFVTE